MVYLMGTAALAVAVMLVARFARRWSAVGTQLDAMLDLASTTPVAVPWHSRSLPMVCMPGYLVDEGEVRRLKADAQTAQVIAGQVEGTSVPALPEPVLAMVATPSGTPTETTSESVATTPDVLAAPTPQPAPARGHRPAAQVPPRVAHRVSRRTR